MKIYRWHNLFKVISLFIFFVIGFFSTYYDISLKKGIQDKASPIHEITKQIHVIVSDYYLGCHHNEEKILEFDAEDYQKYLSELTCDWEVREVDDQTHTYGKKALTKKISGLCPVCKTHDYLGIYQNNVAVYHGIPERPGPVKEVTRINVLGLPENEIIDLSRGVIYKDEREKLFILEGYSELTPK